MQPPAQTASRSASDQDAIRKRLNGVRILSACDLFSPESSGGIERVAFEVVTRFAGWGAELAILTALPGAMKPFDLPNGSITKRVGMLDVSGPARAQVGVAPGSVRAASALIKRFKPDVILANGLHFQTSLASVLAGKSVPIVIASHVAALDYLPQPTRSLTRAYEHTIGRFMLTRSRRVIADSASVRDHMLTLGVSPEKVDVVPNGVDLTRFYPTERADGVPTLMFVGRHIANKGPQVFLEALVILKRKGVPFSAVIVSDGPMRGQLEKRSAEAGIQSIVEFTGHVPDTAVEMRRADVIVRPSFTEGMPLTMLEAMASGICLVVSDIPGNRDVLVDEVNGLMVPAGDSSKLAEALERTIRDPHLRRRLAAGGQRTVQQYSWEACSTAYAESLLRAIDA